MAYMSSKPFVPDPKLVSARGPGSDGAELGTLFSSLEEAVIDLSARDTIGSLNAVPALIRPIHYLISGGHPTMMANARLEALRRFCVLQRHHRHVRDEERQRFLDAGYTEVQARRLATMLQPRRRRGPDGSSLLTLLLGLVVALIVYASGRWRSRVLCER